ncbi:glycosyltransferase [Puniceibacterium sediminis]|uniref:Glycosyl transferase family 2 n=1 Tax=Puniceibacterium sediminis TaxID=1608407 RepID=A0A238YNH1_9RHOB|nr:glycosyltransferase [Puniceibacterium sediminis]SNR72695.1 Glycosyl transferase family 2 [Puniceibacterium sediminis]
MADELPGTGTEPHIGILMAVYNGASHLREQLDSIAQQDHADWQVLASDDGSTDGSCSELDRFAAEHQLTRMEGPRRGNSADNFLSLIRRAGDHLPTGAWIAFSDQDDIWLPDKLSRGVAALRDLPDGRPGLYCSRTWITDETLSTRRLSMPRPRPTGFRNALVQNIASGNTILLNTPAAALVRAAAAEVGAVVVHDWWLYQIVTGAGGWVAHDDAPSLLYRQHGVNQIGANDTTLARIRRVRQLLRGDFREWNRINIAALTASAHRLTPQNRARLERFAEVHDARLWGRLTGLARLRLYRQSTASTIALWVSAFLGWL